MSLCATQILADRKIQIIFVPITVNNNIVKTTQNIHKKINSCYRTVRRAIWEISPEFVIFCNFFHESVGELNDNKYEK